MSKSISTGSAMTLRRFLTGKQSLRQAVLADPIIRIPDSKFLRISDWLLWNKFSTIFLLIAVRTNQQSKREFFRANNEVPREGRGNGMFTVAYSYSHKMANNSCLIKRDHWITGGINWLKWRTWSSRWYLQIAVTISLAALSSALRRKGHFLRGLKMLSYEWNWSSQQLNQKA